MHTTFTGTRFKRLLRAWKDKQQIERRYLRNIYLTRIHIYIKSIFNFIRKRQTIRWKNEQKM